MTKKVLVVEDDLTLKPILQPMIRRVQPDVTIDWLTNAEDALARLKESREPYDVVLSDISLAGCKTGIDLVEDCYQSRIPANFVLTSSFDLTYTRLPFLPKPLRAPEVEARLSPYLRSPRLRPKRATLRIRGGRMEDSLENEQALGWLFIVLMATAYVWMRSAH